MVARSGPMQQYLHVSCEPCLNSPGSWVAMTEEQDLIQLAQHAAQSEQEHEDMQVFCP